MKNMRGKVVEALKKRVSKATNMSPEEYLEYERNSEKRLSAIKRKERLRNSVDEATLRRRFKL